jgi:hypothetical protein
MSYEDEKVRPTSGGNKWNSSYPKLITIGIAALIGIVVLWKIISSSKTQELPKSNTEQAIQDIRDKTESASVEARSSNLAENLDIEGSDLPAGDKSATRILQEARMKDEAAAKRLMDAETQARLQAEYTHYIKRTQTLPHDKALADRWEARVYQARTSGEAIAAPKPLDKESVDLLQSKNPKLLAQARGESVGADATQSEQPQKTKDADATKAQSAQSGDAAVRALNSTQAAIPPNIDPQTGLPMDAVAVGGIVRSTNAVNPIDGMPDIDGGAVPITLTYIPAGETQAVSIVRWVRPEFLDNRAIPYDPKDLVQINQSYWSSLKAPSDLSEDKAAASVKIPSIHRSSKSRATGAGNFKATNNYVIVLPNPDGQLDPPNPKPR